VIGAVVGGFIFKLLGIQTESLIGSLVTALAGAILLLSILRIFKR